MTNAMERAWKLMQTPNKDLPPIVQAYKEELGKRIGLCMETCLTAFAHYAQVIEGLPCKDPAYMADEEAHKFFQERKTA